MLRAYDIMTRAIATAAPGTPVSQVATMMRDLNIGDVLVLEEGKLRGIVTDRDLTINVLTNGANSSAPIERYMTTDVVTGSPDWSLDHVASVMGEHQVRRLPIVQDDNVIGIVSLGDVAVHTSKRNTVADSLKDISETTRTRFGQARPMTKVIGLLVPIGLGAAILLFANSKSGQRVRRQLQESDFADQARNVIGEAVNVLQDPKTRQAALDALESTGLPKRTRQILQEGVHALASSQTRVNQLTGDLSKEGAHASERAMQLAQQAQHLAQQAREQAQHMPHEVTNASERAMHLAEQAQHMAQQAQHQAQHLPHEVTQRLHKSKSKRFLFA